MRIPGFYKLSFQERLSKISQLRDLTSEERKWLLDPDPSQINNLLESVIGIFPLPLGIATNFLVNSRDYLIPMALEEPSVIAGASNAAKIARESGGFHSEVLEWMMIGQIQILTQDAESGALEILEHKSELLDQANKHLPSMVKLGGGARDVEPRILHTPQGDMLVVHILIDPVDAMGANAINRVCEKLAPMLESITGGRALLRIISNLADRRLVRASAIFRSDLIGGREILEGILMAHQLALNDPYRAVTHNKGIMNGIIAVGIATGNDTRALEAAAHSYASRDGSYRPLSDWSITPQGDLKGELIMPIPVGIVGGGTVNPVARICLKILGVSSAKELAQVMGAVGLSNNFAALRALVAEGITKGHMRLHAKNLAMAAGARGEEVELVADRMISQGEISYNQAIKILEQMRCS